MAPGNIKDTVGNVESDESSAEMDLEDILVDAASDKLALPELGLGDSLITTKVGDTLNHFFSETLSLCW